MSEFEYVSVLISIVLGLGIAQLLSNVHKLVQAREHVRFYWLTVLWAILIFVSLIEWWWASFLLRETASWNFFYFLFLLASPVTLYLASAFVLPAVEVGVRYDLREYYFATRKWPFGVLVVNLIVDAVRRAVHAHSLTDFGALSNAVAALILAVLVFTERAWYHALITLAVAALFLYFIADQAVRLV